MTNFILCKFHLNDKVTFLICFFIFQKSGMVTVNQNSNKRL